MQQKKQPILLIAPFKVGWTPMQIGTTTVTCFVSRGKKKSGGSRCKSGRPLSQVACLHATKKATNFIDYSF